MKKKLLVNGYQINGYLYIELCKLFRYDYKT